MNKTSSKKKLALSFLCSTMCLSLCVASITLAGNAEGTTVNTTDLITLDTAAASVTAAKTHTATGENITYNGSELSYTGLTVGTENNAEPYSGKINGTFTGSTTIEYKFSGSSESYTKYDANNAAAWRGNNLGNFRWTITSVSDPTQTYTVEIYGTKDKSAKNASNTQIVGYKVRPTNTSETYSLQIFDFVPNPDAAKEITNFFNGSKDTGAPRFNTDGSDVREEIYFEQTADGLAISYIADKYNGYSYVDNNGRYGTYTANKGQKATITTLSAEEFDASQGYTISFCSDIDKELSDRYGVKFCSTINNVDIEEESSPITFLSINGCSMANETVEATDGEAVYMMNGKVLKSGDTFQFSQNTEQWIQKATGGRQVYSADGNSLTLDTAGATNYQKLDTTIPGTYSQDIGGISFTYTVLNAANATDLITLDTASASVTPAKTHTATGENITYNGSELSYTGLTVGTENNAEPYSGKINGTFTGSTTIEYKFSGSSESYTKYDANNSAAWRGNNLGNFRWTITSVSDPTQTYTVEIYGTKDKSAKNASNTQIVGYKVRPTNTNDTYSLQIFDFVPTPDAATEITNFFNGGKDTGAPRFNTDGSDVREEIYFEQTADGLAISYIADKYNSSSYVDNNGRYGTYTANKGQKATITTLSAEEFDASQGYTISFCSDIDKELSDRYGVKFCSTINNVAIEEESSPITFLAINELDLSGETFDAAIVSSGDDITSDAVVDVNGSPFILANESLPTFYCAQWMSPVGVEGYTFPVKKDVTVPDISSLDFSTGSATITVGEGETAKVFTVVKVDGETIKPIATSLTLDGTIGVNFYMYIPNVENKTIQFSYGTATESVDVAAISGKNEVYKLTVYVAAKDYATIITAQAFENGESASEQFTYSAKAYCDAIISGNYSEEMTALCKTLVQYGEMAKAYFGDTQAEYTGEDVTAEQLESYATQVEGTLPDGVAMNSTSLVLESATTLKIYFTATTLDGLKITVDGNEVTPATVGTGVYCISIANISAKDLDTVYTVAIGDDTNIYNIKICALSYAYQVLSYDTELDADLVSTVKALYLYNKAAKAYFGK